VFKSSCAKSGRIKIKERCIHADREHFNIIIIPKMGYAKFLKKQQEAAKTKQQGRKWKLVELGEIERERDAHKIYSYF